MSEKKPRGEMSFLDHLEELRWAILKCVLAILAGMIVCFLFSTQILNFLIEPTRLESLGIELQSFKPAGMFTIRINVSLVVGFAMTLPFILYQLWRFVSPGLLDNEKKFVPYIILFSCLLFLLGGAFAFYVLIPVMVSFFIEIYIPGVKAIWDIGFYIGLVNKMVLLMGIVFQMPVAVGFLTWIRVLSYDFLIRTWRYAMVIIFIAAAVVTPTGDPYTQTLVAIPLVILFFISLGISRLIGGGREKPTVDNEDEGDDSDEARAFEQPAEPDSPTIPRGSMPYMGPEAGMEYWPDEDDEFIYDYENEVEEKENESEAEENGESTDQSGKDSDADDSVEPEENAPEKDVENQSGTDKDDSKDSPDEGHKADNRDSEDDEETDSSELRN